MLKLFLEKTTCKKYQTPDIFQQSNDKVFSCNEIFSGLAILSHSLSFLCSCYAFTFHRIFSPQSLRFSERQLSLSLVVLSWDSNFIATKCLVFSSIFASLWLLCVKCSQNNMVHVVLPLQCGCSVTTPRPITFTFFEFSERMVPPCGCTVTTLKAFTFLEFIGRHCLRWRWFVPSTWWYSNHSQSSPSSPRGELPHHTHAPRLDWSKLFDCPLPRGSKDFGQLRVQIGCCTQTRSWKK